MAVEAALLTPLVVLLLIGMMEMSLFLRDGVAVNAAVRSAARVASSAAGAGPGVCQAGSNPPPCTPATAPAFAQAAADAVQRAGSALPADSITAITVYEANSGGYPLPEGNTAIVCTSNCVTYVWDAALNRFRFGSGSWASSSVNACVNSVDQDTVGVALTARHTWVTGMFGSGVGITQRSVMRFEPLAAEQCLPGTHP
ncbi:hypothetical protein GCM10022215_43500 [Nocardioides fonticola]|uniref:TadE-like domain-containing protein n=1 Tax=Nocardioides fonticola TaxID=450363 RepID=A0ABP7Y3B2_9ACTN